jgi:hypothetical protein
MIDWEKYIGILASLVWLTFGCAAASPPDQVHPVRQLSGKVRPVNAQKLDQALLDEIALRRQEHSPSGELLDELFDVEIALTEEIAMPRGLSRQQALAELERWVERSQADLVARLRELGVNHFEPLLLANAIATTLTLQQIGEISQRDDVRLIRLRRVTKVTTAA